MNRKIYPRLALALLVVGFVAFSALNTLLFGRLRLDLTENRLYTISPGTREIIDSIDEPIDLYFFFSDKATREAAPLRTYAKRVRELLEEYALRADGKLRLHIIDPQPFSEAEDQAAEFGLQAVPLSMGGDNVYFGLAAANAYGEKQTIGFFQPEREEFLEYEVSKLLNSLIVVKRPVIGLLTGLPMSGGFDMMSSRPTPPWAVLDQIQQGFDVRTIEKTAQAIDKDISTLMIVHPAGLSDATLYAVDQFVMRGGKAIVYIDPFCESARAGNPMMEQSEPQTTSNPARLLAAWGVTFDPGRIVGDIGTALQISAGDSGRPVRHVGFLGLTADNVARGDVVTGSLESLNLGMAGALGAAKNATTTFEPLLQSSAQSMLLDGMQVQMTRDPEELLRGFKPGGERYTLAARISGPAKSAFAKAQQEGQEYVAESKGINVIVVADADMLADRFWVQVQNFFGQQIATAWSDNAAFAQNALENLSGSSALIGIRSRGRFSRPFELVERIRLGADERYRASAETLQKRLEETERQLEELQRGKQESNQLVLSPEQERAVSTFQDEKLRIRKELREVRHQLDQDIDNLGMWLKLINIVVMPVLLTVLLYGLHQWRSARRRAA
jgi:ABC-type uncharacterized transport system involved in gliding motility auxiliary subunit